jgi:hypothetical protein
MVLQTQTPFSVQLLPKQSNFQQYDKLFFMVQSEMISWSS